MLDRDDSVQLAAQVQRAYAEARPLAIIGNGSKAFHGRSIARGEPLNVGGHRGILRYEPTELFITARAGTPLAEVESVLSESGQMLGFEPPHFGRDASLGGTVACGFSGPRRPYSGSLRDALLGCRIINGQGEVLSFGGEVMKNVAGFDVSRLMAGALGTLGVLLDVTLRVAPRPAAEMTLQFELAADDALEAMAKWGRGPWPLSAMAYDGRVLWPRLAGAEAAVYAAAKAFGGEQINHGDSFWRELREHQLDFFAGNKTLWRLSLAPASPPINLPGEWFFDWGGALRWLASDAPADHIFAAAQAVGGHATAFRGALSQDVFQPLDPGLAALHRRLKAAFDPKGILNPGRLYPDF